MPRTYDVRMRITSLKDDNKSTHDINEFLTKIMDETGKFIGDHSRDFQRTGDIHVYAVVSGNDTKPLMERKSLWSFMETFNSLDNNNIKDGGCR